MEGSPGYGFTFFHFIRHPHQVFQGFVNLVLGGEVERSGHRGVGPTLHDTLVIVGLMSPYELEESMTSGRFIMVTRFGRRANPYRRFTWTGSGSFTSGTIPTRKFEQFGVNTDGLFGIITHIFQGWTYKYNILTIIREVFISYTTQWGRGVGPRGRGSPTGTTRNNFPTICDGPPSWSYPHVSYTV